jgi:hypothetical protein
MMPEKLHDLRRELVTYLHFLVGPSERMVPCEGCTPYRRLSYAALGLAATFEHHAALCTLPSPGYTWWRSVCLTQPYPQPRLPFIGHSTQLPALSRLLQQLPEMRVLQWPGQTYLFQKTSISFRSSHHSTRPLALSCRLERRPLAKAKFLKLHSRGAE